MRASVRWMLLCLIALALQACPLPPAAALPEATAPATAAVGKAPPPALPAPAKPVLQPAVYRVSSDYCAIPDAAIDLIIAFEVGSPDVYTQKYQRPIWPGAVSGVTVGLGYDLGYHAPNVIALDWQAHPHHVRLVTASGISGPIARQYARRLADITIEYGFARAVFDQTSVTEHFRLTRRAFGDTAVCTAPAGVRGALLSLVFNRGAAMQGKNRAEMRTIRDICLPARDWTCVAQALRDMARIWQGTDIERGMHRRRFAEADLIEVHA